MFWARVYLSERIGSERVGRAESLCALLLGVTYKPARLILRQNTFLWDSSSTCEYFTFSQAHVGDLRLDLS